MPILSTVLPNTCFPLNAVLLRLKLCGIFLFLLLKCNGICLTLSFPDVRQILVDQVKSFDHKTEGKVLFLADLQEFFRRLSEIELEYSRNLERLSRMYLDKLQRHKSQRWDSQMFCERLKRKCFKREVLWSELVMCIKCKLRKWNYRLMQLKMLQYQEWRHYPWQPLHVREYLHDTRATFAPGRVHSGSLSLLYICLHDTTTKCRRESPRCEFTPVLAPEREFHSGRKSHNGIM